MCELFLGNTGDAELNKLMFLLLGSLGSVQHNDGWGFSDGVHMSKCEFPMYYDERAGETLRKVLTSKSSNKPLLGHIRKASARVPVTKENAHPFVEKNITFAHNGTLKPFDEKKYPQEYEVEVEDAKTKKLEKKKFNYSDSKIFFDAFMKNYKEEKNIVEVLNETMADFHGKFAFLISINGKFYIARGKTANLYISWRMDKPGEDGKPLGYIVHTNNSLLDTCEVLATNLYDLQGKEELFFSPPVLLKDETIFFADKTTVVELGELKENSAPTYSHSKATATSEAGYWETEGNFMEGTSGISTAKKDRLFCQVLDFMKAFSLSAMDVQIIIMELYECSTKEVQEPILEHFVNKVVPQFGKKTDKQIRKRLRKALGDMPVGLMTYYNTKMEFPWFLNPKSEQLKFVESLEKKK